MFVYRSEDSRVYLECDDIFLDTVVEEFSNFLKGCGFQFKEIEVIPLPADYHLEEGELTMEDWNELD